MGVEGVPCTEKKTELDLVKVTGSPFYSPQSWGSWRLCDHWPPAEQRLIYKLDLLELLASTIALAPKQVQ